MVKTLPSSAGVVGSISGQGAKIPHASQPKNQKNIKQKQYYNKFNKDFKNSPQQKNLKKKKLWGFPGGTVVENLPANAGDTGSNPGLGGSHMLWSN